MVAKKAVKKKVVTSKVVQQEEAKYPNLVKLLKILKIVGNVIFGLSIALGVIVAIVLAFTGKSEGGAGMLGGFFGGLALSLFYVVWGWITMIIFHAIAEFGIVAMDIEKNTRKK